MGGPNEDRWGGARFPAGSELTDNPLWCILQGLSCKAAAPTGIAAANVEVEGTDVTATTLHALLELDGELKTKLDLAKLDHAKVAALMKLQVGLRRFHEIYAPPYLSFLAPLNIYLRSLSAFFGARRWHIDRLDFDGTGGVQATGFAPG